MRPADAMRDCSSWTALCLPGTQHGCGIPASANRSNSFFMRSTAVRLLLYVRLRAQTVDVLFDPSLLLLLEEQGLDVVA